MTAARRGAAEQVRLDAARGAFFERRIAFNDVLGLRVESLKRDNARLSFTMRRELAIAASGGCMPV